MRKSLALYLFAFFAVSPTWANPTDLADRFGIAITAGDGHLFISESGGFETHGMVHVYVRGDDQKWVWKNSLHGDAHVGDGFGHTIGYGDGILAVADQSAVYVFELDPETDHFVQTDRLESEDNCTFGSALALDDGWLAVGSSQADGSAGQVHLLQKNPEGTWVRRAILAEPGESSVSMYGSALSMDQGRLLIGSPGLCTSYLYEYQADGWGLSATLPCGELSGESMYGMTLDLKGERAVIGAPQHNSRKGAVAVWQQENTEDSEWKKIKILAPEEDAIGSFFGFQVEIQDPLRIVVGFPVFGSRDTEENLRVYAVEEDGDSEPEYTTVPGIGFSLGSTVAVDGSVMAVGSPSAAYGEGSAELLELNNSGVWEMVQEVFYVHDHMPRKADILCDDGQAEGFDCGLVDLVSFLPNEEMEMNRGVRLSDVWGWADPETGIEYGLIGHLEGTVFLDLSTPSSPRYLGTLPRTEGSPGSTWRDIKVYKDHAFIVADGAREHGMQIFDLTQLRGLVDTPVEFKATAHYDRIHSAHNIVINEETGFAFAVGASAGGETCGGGLHMIDIREPEAPVFAGCFADETTGRRKTGYSHDAQCVIYNGPDSEYAGREVCFGANETAISISDVTDKENPVAIGTGSYPDAAYVHQGWLTEDHSYFFQNDELDEIQGKVHKTRTLVWDVRDLSDPIMIREFYGPTSATDHNLYIHGNLMYQTNNASGLRIIDVSSPEDPVEIGHFDTTPYGTDEAGFNGTWSSFPYFESGIIVVTSRREGVFILKKQPVDI